MNNCYLDSDNLLFIESLYKNYCNDKNSVEPSWQQFFSCLDVKSPSPTTLKNESNDLVNKSSEHLHTIVFSIVNAYRKFGHMVAQLDPLQLRKLTCPQELSYDFYELDEAELNQSSPLAFQYLGPTITKLIEQLKIIYCGTIGIEYMHLAQHAERNWWQEQIENNSNWRETFSPQQKQDIYYQIAKAEIFESYLNIKFPGAKRFSIEGSEAVLPIMETIIQTAAEKDTKEIVLGMAHRGRVNFLCNIFDKSYKSIFAEFAGKSPFPEEFNISGDVKYHLGASTDKVINNKQVHLTLSANPSHLEAVNAVVTGKVKAKQDDYQAQDKVKGILIHGDAAFAGQGIIYETFILETVEGYTTGGVIHIIINNQVGFTTNSKEATKFTHPSFVGKGFDLPILHVNGEDPEAAVRVAKLATEYCYFFKKDIIIDLVVYRRYGHNEGDEPRFTQPLMYKKIDALSTLMKSYGANLLQQKSVNEETLTQIQTEIRALLDRDFKLSSDYVPQKADAYEGKWLNIALNSKSPEPFITGIALQALKELGQSITVIPNEVTLNDKIHKFIEHRSHTIATGENIDWSTAEALAFASLLKEGHRVRLAGQDCGRGTFTQRHATWVDQNTGSLYIPFNNIPGQKETLHIINSPLSEYAALGFEYGYSLVNPNNLVIWEAQFGDFVNGAQIVIDQFIVASETKWLRSSNLVVLLPHGYEGQGPEHSSGRIERFLQMAAENNIRVVNCSTPANYFHSLRRQITGDTRKPLIVFSPKSLLRNKAAVSSIAEMAENTYFQEVIEDKLQSTTNTTIKRVVICSGKIYYELREGRSKAQITNIVLIRLEQFYPFPLQTLTKIIQSYPDVELIWCQEEPENMGGWNFVFYNLHKAGINIKYCGREKTASTATGYASVHNMQQKNIINAAIVLE